MFARCGRYQADRVVDVCARDADFFAPKRRCLMSTNAIVAGEQVVKAIAQCYQANQPVMLCGPHGIGKSDLFKTAADRLGIRFITRDLSLMESTDLAGMPYRDAAVGRTKYAPPAFLPKDGCGLLTIEEINRAPRFVQAPCFQMLTERRLNDYVLPRGWLPMAAMNPSDGDYLVDEVDQALLSRFVQLRVRADVGEWTRWAEEHGKVHAKVIEFARQNAAIFDPGETNPRSLTYLSRQVTVWEQTEKDSQTLMDIATGLVGETWAIAFHQFLTGGEAPLTVPEIVDRFSRHKKKFVTWVSTGKMDLVRASMQPLQRHLSEPENVQAIIEDTAKIKHVKDFIQTLPADLRRQMHEWLAERGYEQFL